MLEICLRSNFAGTESFRLYSETFVGTKGLVQEWVDEGQSLFQPLLHGVADVSVSPFALDKLFKLFRIFSIIVAICVAFIRQAPDSMITLEEKAKFLRYSAKNLGATALCLSGGASFGYCKFRFTISSCSSGDLPGVTP